MFEPEIQDDRLKFNDDNYLLRLAMEDEKPDVSGKKSPLLNVDKTFFKDLFVPKDGNFQNKINDLTLDENRFIYYPFVYPEKIPHSKKGSKKTNKNN